MIEIICIIILLILGMPFFGIYLIVSDRQEGNRGLGVALFVIGIAVWSIYGLM